METLKKADYATSDIYKEFVQDNDFLLQKGCFAVCVSRRTIRRENL